MSSMTEPSVATPLTGSSGSRVGDEAPPSAGLPGRFGWLAIAILGGWAIAALATLAHADVILLPLAVLAVAALLRVGRGLVDRLMFATVVTAAVLVVGGLVFSLWPWGLDPLPVAGVVFNGIAVVAWLTGRRPRLTRRVSGSDLVIVGSGLFVLAAGLRGTLRIPGLARFAISATSEDRLAHFAFFDAIHRLGGYPMLNQAAAKISIRPPAQASYPTGSHFLYAVVDVFLRSTTDPGATVSAFNRYFYLILGGYAFLVVATIWAARWIVTPLVTGWRQVAVVAVIGAVLIGGPYFSLVTAGFDSEVVGLTFLVLTVAVAVRPPARLGERLLLFGACLILTAYVYYLYLPIVVVALLASLLVHGGLRRSWRAIAGVAVVAGALAAVPLYFLLTSTLGLQSQALAAGASLAMPRSATTAATVASLVLLVTARGRRYRRMRVVGLVLPVLLGVIVVFGVYQSASLGKTGYYFDKLMTAYLFVGIVCSATAVLIVPASSVGGRAGRLTDLGLSAASVVLAFSAIAGFGLGPKVLGTLPGEWGDRPLTLGAWYYNKTRDPVAYLVRDQLVDVARRGFVADGTPTLFVVDNYWYVNWRLTFLDGVLNRTNGEHKESVDALIKVPVGGSPVDASTLAGAIAALRQAVAVSPDPLRVVVRDPATADAIRSALADQSGRVTVVLLPAS